MTRPRSHKSALSLSSDTFKSVYTHQTRTALGSNCSKLLRHAKTRELATELKESVVSTEPSDWQQQKIPEPKKEMSRIANRYEIVRQIGEGAFSRVYEAMDF